MIRRMFLAVCFIATASPLVSASVEASANRKFAFKIRTKDGGIVGNVLIEAHDVDAAKFKLMKRYPGCVVLRVDEK